MLRDGPGEVALSIPPPHPDNPNRSPTGLRRAGPADIRDYLWIAPPNLGARQENRSINDRFTYFIIVFALFARVLSYRCREQFVR